MTTLRIASRKTPLARQQAQLVATALQQQHHHLTIEWLFLSTQGDQQLDRPLYDIGGKGLFLKELEKALLDDRADLAVHSMKDVPHTSPPGLSIDTICMRVDPRDAWISDHLDWITAPAGFRVGTSSLRRSIQLQRQHPHLDVIPLRGSIHTRLEQLQQGRFDAIVLAMASLDRMAWTDRPHQPLAIADCVPAPGQGALALQCRQHDAETAALLQPLQEPDTAFCVQVERAVSARLGGDCHAPVGVWAQRVADQLELHAFMAQDDGSNPRYVRSTAALDDHTGLVDRVATHLCEVR